jgi:hypothetical protein
VVVKASGSRRKEMEERCSYGIDELVDERGLEI